MPNSREDFLDGRSSGLLFVARNNPRIAFCGWIRGMRRVRCSSPDVALGYTIYRVSLLTYRCFQMQKKVWKNIFRKREY